MIKLLLTLRSIINSAVRGKGTFIIRAQIANKFIRFAKWKIRKLCFRFGDVLYTELYISKTSTHRDTNNVLTKMGVPGLDIIIKSEDTDLKRLWSELLSAKLKMQLRKKGEKRYTS